MMIFRNGKLFEVRKNGTEVLSVFKTMEEARAYLVSHGNSDAAGEFCDGVADVFGDYDRAEQIRLKEKRKAKERRFTTSVKIFKKEESEDIDE